MVDDVALCCCDRTTRVRRRGTMRTSSPTSSGTSRSMSWATPARSCQGLATQIRCACACTEPDAATSTPWAPRSTTSVNNAVCLHWLLVCYCCFRWGCGAYLPPNLIGAHEVGGCPKRHVECGFNCGTQNLLAENLLYHQQRECPLREFECHLGCGAVMHGRDEPHHLAEVCPNRLVECVTY